MPDNFSFDAEFTPEENIQRFFEFLERSNSQMAQLLKEVIPALIPLPEPGPQRTSKRRQANEYIARELENSENSRDP
jgi:hypothetical protein